MPVTSSPFRTKRSRYAVLMGLLSLLLGGLGAFVFIAEPATIAVAADRTIWRFMLLTFYISMVVSLIGYRLLAYEQEEMTSIEKLTNRQARRDWLGRLVVSFGVAWILTVGCQAVFLYVIGRLFADALLPRMVMMLLFAVYGALLGFGVAFFIVGVDDTELFWMVAVLGAGGLLFSLTLVQNAEWWKRSVSALGIDSGSALFFNVTVIFVGMVALTLARDLVNDLKLLTDIKLFPMSGYELIRFGLTGLGLAIVGIGLFPTEGMFFSHALHQVSAYVMAGLCFAGMLGLKRIAPDIYSQNFIYLSRAFAVACALIVVGHLAQIIEFTVMEVVLFATFGAWVDLFRLETKGYIRQHAATVVMAATAAAAAQQTPELELGPVSV